MPTPKPLPLKLTEAEKEGLEKLVKRHNVGQQIALRVGSCWPQAADRTIVE